MSNFSRIQRADFMLLICHSRCMAEDRSRKSSDHTSVHGPFLGANYLWAHSNYCVCAGEDPSHRCDQSETSPDAISRKYAENCSYWFLKLPETLTTRTGNYLIQEHFHQEIKSSTDHHVPRLECPNCRSREPKRYKKTGSRSSPARPLLSVASRLRQV